MSDTYNTKLADASLPPDWDDLREQRIRFLAQGAAEVLAELEVVTQERDTARRQVRDLRAELARLQHKTWGHETLQDLFEPARFWRAVLRGMRGMR